MLSNSGMLRRSILAAALLLWLSASGSTAFVLAADQPSGESHAAHAASENGQHEGNADSEHGDHHAASDEQANHEESDGHGGNGEHGEHGASAGPLTWQTDLAIWTAAVFLLLVIVLYKFAWGPLAEALDRRERTIAENIEAARRSNEEAKRHLAEYERKLAAAQDEVRAILDEARRDAEQTQRDILAKANEEAEAIKDRARREIETATSAALKELADRSARLAVELAGKIIHAELDPERHKKLIEESLARFPANSQN